MKNFAKFSFLVSVSALMAACGGGGGGSTAVVTPVVTPTDKTTYTLTNPPASTYSTDSAQKKMFDTLNQLRIGGGFGALEQDTRIDQAATAHADYVVTNYFAGGVPSPDYFTILADGWITAHTELQGMTGYTGARPATRIALTGYQAISIGEVLAVEVGLQAGLAPDMTNCLSRLVNSVFHRAALLDTIYLDVGFGISKPIFYKNGYIGRACVINFAAKQAAPILAQNWIGIYPFNAQKNVPLLMADEIPDPVPTSLIKGGPVNIQTSANQNLVVTSFVLRNAAGLTVPTKLLTKTDTLYLRSNEAYLIPLGSLIANSEYFVTFEGTSNGMIVSKSWSFGTESK